MKVFIAIAWILPLIVSGCASSPPSSRAETEPSPITEETVTTVPGTGKDFLILRQPGGTKNQTDLERPGDASGKKPDSDASAGDCPPGQLMATRVISGETGTRTSEECVTPFASMGQKYKRQQPVAIKLRNAGRNLKVKTVKKAIVIPDRQWFLRDHPLDSGLHPVAK